MPACTSRVTIPSASMASRDQQPHFHCEGRWWCPTSNNLAAYGGGCNDHCVKFWNTVNGACLNSIDAGSEVCALLWDKNKSELLTSHGSPNNQLTLWNYPSMTRVAEVSGHSSRVHSLAGSPLGGVVACGGETIKFWNIFETPKITKPERPLPNLMSS
ncbi:unnamed protein product [Musa acuminata subsp. burmannicoides]